MSRRRRPATSSSVPRTARVNELLREVLADELSLIDDERLEHVTITGVSVDPDLSRAVVFFDALEGAEADARVLDGFARWRPRLQDAVARQVKVRKTPVLQFKPDEAIRAGERIDEILRTLPPVDESAGLADAPDAPDAPDSPDSPDAPDSPDSPDKPDSEDGP